MKHLSAGAALLVIDVQNAFFRAETRPFDGQGVVERIGELAGNARSAGLPVFFIQHEDPVEGVIPGSKGWQLEPALAVDPQDHLVRKTTCDAFYGTRLEADLGARRIDTLILTGYATEFCMDSTLRSALGKEFKVIVVADAHTTGDNPVLGAPKVREFYNWVWANLTSPRPVEVVPAKDLAFHSERDRH